MEPFDFRVVLDQVDVDEAEADALYARCKDGTLITSGRVTYMDVGRQADSLENAIRGAVADVEAAGFGAARVEIEAASLAQ